MAAKSQVEINIDITGLGTEIVTKDIFIDAVSPSEGIHSQNLTQTTADVAQALYIGDTVTIRGVWIKAIDNDVLIDTSFVSSFNGELLIREGTSMFFVPTGIIYFRNSVALEKSTIESVLFGV